LLKLKKIVAYPFIFDILANPADELWLSETRVLGSASKKNFWKIYFVSLVVVKSIRSFRFGPIYTTLFSLFTWSK